MMMPSPQGSRGVRTYAGLLAVVAVAALVVLVVRAQGSPRSDGPIKADGPYDGARVTAQNVQRTTLWSSGGVAACVTSVPDDLEVTGVGLLGLEGQVTVQGGLLFGADPIESVAPKPLPPEYVAAKDFSASMLELTDCASPGGPRLWVGVNVTSEAHWKATGLYLEYRADGREYRTELPLGMNMCAAGEDPAPECQGRPPTPEGLSTSVPPDRSRGVRTRGS